MRVLYVQTSDSGHRLNYLQALSESGLCESVALVNRINDCIRCKQILYTASDFHINRSIKSYLDWIKEIDSVAINEKCDAVHILDGDQIYRYFGLGLKKISVPVVVTYHHMAFDRIRTISIKRIFAATAMGVVHTESLRNELLSRNITNVTKVEYPYINKESTVDSASAKKKFGIPADRVCFSFIGGITEYKGLNYLLEAMNNVKHPFTLHIAGKPVAYSEEYIRSAVENYKDKTVLDLHRLDNDEYVEAIIATDYLVLPYKREFDGASGLMIDATWYRKPVIAANHGSMGDIVNRFELGVTFETENADDLARKIEGVIENGLGANKKSEEFRDGLKVETFLEAYYDIFCRITRC